MIPADVASRLRLATQEQPAPSQPVTSIGKLTDVLSDLVPGQRLMAEIQTLLPNGTYRATIAQRDVVLSLPFSAKTGDSLELEVVESDGKLTLAFLASRTPAGQTGGGAESVSTFLSQAGRLIGNLLSGIDEGAKHGQPAPLNGNQPLLADFPKDAAQLAPALKAALTGSGMFYEAHQARWLEGTLPAEALLQEPQGKFSSLLHPQGMPAQPPAAPSGGDAAPMQGLPRPGDLVNTRGTDGAAAKPLPPGPIPADLAPLIRQQLDALATQNYVWQGQIWPGQQMHWEIEAVDEEGRRQRDEGDSQQWHTRLRLTLPGLGGIQAVMHLRSGGAVDISLITEDDTSRQKLVAAGEGLRRQFDEAGLKLAGMAVLHGEVSR